MAVSAASAASVPSRTIPAVVTQVAVSMPSTVTARSLAPLPRIARLESALNPPVDVVVHREQHQAHEKKQAHLLGHLSVPHFDRPAEHGFCGEEEEMPAVEDRDRQQVQDAEVDAEKR